MIEGCGKIVKPAAAAVLAPPPTPIVAAPPPPPVAVVAPPSPKPAPAATIVPVTPKQMRVVTLESDTLFAFDSASPQGDLQTLTQRLGGLRSVEAVQIVGHTDNIGPAAYNEQLSVRRADSIKQLLVKIGVDPSKKMLERASVKPQLVESKPRRSTRAKKLPTEEPDLLPAK